MTTKRDDDRRRCVRRAGVLLLCALGGCDPTPDDPGRAPPEARVLDVIDLGVVEQDDALVDRDGGYSGSLGDRDVWVFGDTVIDAPNSDGQIWLSSSWSTVTDRDAGDGLERLELGRDAFGSPVELLPFTDEELRFNRRHQGDPCEERPCGARWALWPGPVIRDEARGRSLVFYTKLYVETGELNFRGIGHSLSVWDDAAARPERPTFDAEADEPTLLFGENEPGYGAAAVRVDDHLYAFACDRDGTVKPCRLARVTLSAALDKSAWEHFAGERGWTADSVGSVPLFHGNDIMSVSFNDHLGHFVALYGEPLGRDIVLRTAPALTGPWSAPLPVARALESSIAGGWVYDALAHLELEQRRGRLLYVSYTREPPGERGRELRLLQIELAATDEDLAHAPVSLFAGENDAVEDVPDRRRLEDPLLGR